MKIRNGFVSNSSSSSFICDICEENVSGMDVCLSEAEMSECQNGHTICDSHILHKDKEQDRYSISESSCPVCCFKSVDVNALYIYLRKKLYKNDKELLKEIKNKFKTYEKFIEFISK